MFFFKFRQGEQPPASDDVPSPSPKSPGRGRKVRAEATVNPLETVEALRRRARHRLMGAAVLVLAAIVGFPLLFDSEPRPLVVHAPIVIPDRNEVAPLLLPAPGTADSQEAVDTVASLDAREEVVPSLRGRAEVVQPDPAVLQAERARQEQARQEARRQIEAEAREKARVEAEERARRQAQAAESRRQADEQARLRQQEEQERARKQATEKAAADKAAAEKAAAEKAAEQERARREAERARAALEGRSAQPAGNASARFVVQIGAFSQDDKVREVRQQAERGGLKTHTQVVDTPQGKRTRVRLGPYASRAEAEQALVKLKLVGLDGNVQSP